MGFPIKARLCQDLEPSRIHDKRAAARGPRWGRQAV